MPGLLALPVSFYAVAAIALWRVRRRQVDRGVAGGSTRLGAFASSAFGSLGIAGWSALNESADTALAVGTHHVLALVCGVLAVRALIVGRNHGFVAIISFTTGAVTTMYWWFVGGMAITGDWM